MKVLLLPLALLTLISPVYSEPGLGDDTVPPYPLKLESLTTLDGKEYQQISITQVGPVNLIFRHATGAAMVPFDRLPEGIQRLYGYDPVKAKAVKDEAARKLEEAKREKAEELERKAQQARERAEQKAAQAQNSNNEPAPAPPAEKKPQLDPDVLCKEPLKGVFYRAPLEGSLSFENKYGRKFVIPVQLTKNNLQIGISHGFDNSGDGGMKWEIRLASNGHKIRSGFANDRSWQFWDAKDIPEARILVILTDDDCNFDSGPQPGNGFGVRLREF